MSDVYTPTMIAQRAIDASGVDFILGDIEEGTDVARKVLRAYWDCLRQLLRTAPWGFARKQTPLVLLADGTGQTPDVGTVVPGSSFIYEYAAPEDMAFLRYIPWWPFLAPAAPTGNIQPSNPSSPVVDNLANPPYYGTRVVPARFLLTSDVNYIPNEISQAPNATPWISPIGRLVILTNVPQAQAIYTYNAIYPNQWDQQFRDAMIAYLASEIALPLSKDKKSGMAMRQHNIAIAKDKISNARVSDGRESWSNADLRVDWIQTRFVGGTNGSLWTNGMIGDYNCAYDNLSFGNSSAY